MESIFQIGRNTGRYRESYEGYGRLLQRLAEVRHQSCLLLTSREKPSEVAFWEGAVSTVRSYELLGLKPRDARKILEEKRLHGTKQDREMLIDHYKGNPLALRLVSQLIFEVFGGDIKQFLQGNDLIFSEIEDVLDQQFDRLSPLEQECMYWLAIEREAISLNALQGMISHPPVKRELQEALRSLRRRSLVEMGGAGFTLQNVIMEYLIERFVNRIYEEITTGAIDFFERHAILLAQAKDYIRESQRRLIVQPLLQRLLTTFEKETLEKHFQNLLAVVRAKHDHHPSYAVGNVLNLLIQAGCALRGCDFSHLVVRQAYLQGVDLPEVNFAHADLATSVFTDTFGSILCVAFSPRGDLLAAGTTIGEIRVWHATSGLPLHTFRGHTNWVHSVAFSPDGKTLASSSDDRMVRLWEVSSGQCLNTLQGHTQEVRSVAFSPDGSILASGGDDQMVRLWEVSSGQCLNTLQGHTSAVWSVVFSPDGKILASGGNDQMVRLWKMGNGQCLYTLRSDRPYERMNITRVKGLTEVQKATLRSLGAIENE